MEEHFCLVQNNLKNLELLKFKGDVFKTDLIDKVFTTDTIMNESLNDKIEVYKIMKEGN